MSDFKDNTPFAASLNDMPGVAIGGEAAGAGNAFIAEQGAQVISWHDRSGRERLYLSPISGGMTHNDHHSLHAQAIRGGMPISFPQFSGRGSLPKHGFVRNMRWQLQACDGLAATLICGDDAQSRQRWPHGFSASITAQLAPNRLHVALAVVNTGETPWEFTAALHTYFRVEDIFQVRLHGLQGVSYQDATDGYAAAVQSMPDLTVTQELDRIYLSPPKKLTLLEPGIAPLQIEQHGFEDSVVWNPGPINAAALSDLPDAGWLQMLCVEAACVAVPIRLEPGQSWRGSQTLTVL